MPLKIVNSVSSKTSSCRFTTSRPSSGVQSAKPKVAHPRRVLTSKKLPQNASSDRKANSSGFINDNKKAMLPKKTKSDFNSKQQNYKHIDYCKNCGDASSLTNIKIISNTKRDRSTTENKTNNNTKPERKPAKSIHEHFKNENYQFSTDSVEDITSGVKKISLDTIKEVSEIHPSESIFKITPDSDEDITFLDTDDHDSLRQLKEFRQKNFFECHSAKSRLKNKGDATSLQNHKCVYRFYINDRLFPVPLSTDHNNQVRCVECHLHKELNVDETTKINGTIQAKVTIGKKNQDVMLLLPIKEPLIITEKRKEKPKDREVVFFGVINLDGFGNSLFNSTLPDNSLALKYQKGYKEFECKEEYNYRDFDKADVVVI